MHHIPLNNSKVCFLIFSYLILLIFLESTYSDHPKETPGSFQGMDLLPFLVWSRDWVAKESRVPLIFFIIMEDESKRRFSKRPV